MIAVDITAADDSVFLVNMINLQWNKFRMLVHVKSKFSALKNNENNRLSRYHRFEIASRRATFDSFQVNIKDIFLMFIFVFISFLIDATENNQLEMKNCARKVHLCMRK